MEPERGTRNRNGGRGTGTGDEEPERGTRPWNQIRETLRPYPNSISKKSKWGRGARLPTTPAAQLPDGNPVRRRGAEPARKDEGTGRQKVWEPEVVERGAPGSGGSRQDGLSGPEIRLELTKKRKHGGGEGEPRRRGVSRRVQ